MRWVRSVAWSSTAGFHQRSKWTTCVARVRFEPDSAGPQRRDQHRRARRVLERVDQLLAIARAATPPWRNGTSRSKRSAQVRDEQPPHLGVLREHERRVALGDGLLEHLRRADRACPSAPASGTALVQVQRRVVADLLELGQQREDAAAPAHARPCSLEVGQRLVDGRLVQRRLLDRERARHVGARPSSGRSAAIGGVGLRCGAARTDARAGAGARRHRRRRARPAPRTARRNVARGPSSPGLANCMIDQSSSSRFSTGVPVSARRWRRLERARPPATARADGFLMFCASSRTTRSHVTDASDASGVDAQRRVAS